MRWLSVIALPNFQSAEWMVMREYISDKETNSGGPSKSGPLVKLRSNVTAHGGTARL